MSTSTLSSPRVSPVVRRPVLAGGVVVTRQHPTRGVEVLLVHRPRYDDWTLPKGKLDAGESLPACAVRECLEETGVTVRLGVPLDTIRYQAGKSGMKKVSYWGGTIVHVVKRPADHEVDIVSWVPVQLAKAQLSYSFDHFLLQQYLEQPRTTPLIILRHGKAMDRKDWTRKDVTRPINSRGRRQADLLVPMLGAYGVGRLVSSTATRCQTTVRPYAQASKLSIDSYGQLTEELGADDPRGVTRLVQKIRDQALRTDTPTAICVHRPVLPHILEGLDLAETTLVTGEFLVAHLTDDGEVHAVERHRPQA